jgi:RHS repeat-associated protein
MINGQATTYTWSRGGLDRLLVKTNPDGSITRYVHGLGLIYEETTPSGGGTATAQFYHFNWQGSTMALTDGSGAVTARLSYSPYGEVTVVSGTPNTPFLFNGQFGVMTEPNGLYCMMARFYSPIFRRFLSEDPAGFDGGINLYAYTGGDPINLMDPVGLGPVAGGYSSLLDYFLIASNRNGMLVVLNNSEQLVRSADLYGISPNLVAAVILYEHRGWGFFPGSQYVEGALSYSKSLFNPRANPTYGFAQLGPEARAEAGLSVAQSMTAQGSIDGAAAWLAYKKQELIYSGIPNPSNAQIASRYNAGSNIPLGGVTDYGKNINAIISEVQWNFPIDNK